MRWSRLARQTVQSCVRGLLQALSALAGIPLLVAAVVSIALIPVAIGLVLAPPSIAAIRGFANRQRRRAGHWSGVDIAVPYRRVPTMVSRCLLGDPATWRDLVWLLANAPVGLLLGLLPVCLLANGLLGVAIAPWFWGLSLYWPLSTVLGAAALAALAVTGPRILRLHARFAASLLAPVRVERLRESRAQVLDASAAELRRIERDLHDGAQARLAAMGMNIGLAEQLVRTDPDTAIALLIDAREASGHTLAELRNLVRGIHPPVLAERGLDAAVRALAVAMPLPVDVTIDIGADLAAPVEAALYFAIAEALANVVKHSAASRAWITLRSTRNSLETTVGDNGVGGAAIGTTGGLLGIRRRLAAFDGVIGVTSVPNGPTVVTIELPCAS